MRVTAQGPDRLPNARPRVQNLRLTAVWASLVLGLAACGGTEDGDAEVRVAQARVSAKENALADAKADFAAASDAFCDASRTYILALDRYGDVLTQTVPTVGDVRDAGTDLEAPADDALTGAEDAMEAQQAVTTAEQDLAEAQAALAAAKGDPSSSPAAESPASPEPPVPAATVNRVKQAESEFAATQEGISDETPLVQASQQFNAAAVALEMAWLRLFSDAGCLTDEQQIQAEAAVGDYTLTLQQSLFDAGYYAGEIDGVYGPATVDAVEALQEAHDLPVTGTLDKATAAALEADLTAQGGAAAQAAVASTAAVQQTLTIAGYWNGPVDGVWTPELTQAMRDFQKALGVEPTGAVDAATVAAWEEALAEVEAPSPSESATRSPAAPSGTSSPTAETPSR